MTTFDLPLGLQKIVDEALEYGRWITEDPARLSAFLDCADLARIAEDLSGSASIIAVGMALAHVRDSDARTAMETIVLASQLAGVAIREAKAKEGGQ